MNVSLDNQTIDCLAICPDIWVDSYAHLLLDKVVALLPVSCSSTEKGSLMTTAVPEYKTLTKELIFEVAEFAQSVIEQFAQDVVSTEENPRGGGALAFLLPQDYCFGKVLGDVTESKGLQYAANALNKNKAMKKHGVIISELVADPEADPPIYGGGIQLSDGSCLSFSGFPPEWDQTFCLILAERFDLVTPQRTNSIIETSSDPLKARMYLGTARFFLLHYMFGAALGEVSE